jgi:HD-GYP domain-containing protein (c-di-GMP phosphodiesterase class II)
LDPQTGGIIAFRPEVVDLADALASQAAVAVTNARLIEETKNLFESLIRVLAVALDAKSPYTGNHVQRVALLNSALAQAIGEASDGPFAHVSFTRDQLEEIRLAGWLHDIGKVTTPVAVMDKATKLEAVLDRIELVRARFGNIRRGLEIGALSRRLEAMEGGAAAPELTRIDRELEAKKQELDQDLEFVVRCNQPSEFLDQAAVERLEAIGRKTYEDGEARRPFLTEDELRCLCIRRGTLTEDEMRVMRDHVLWTTRMLGQLAFTKPLRGVPTFAGQHHERLDGKGYPLGLGAQAIPLQSRILAVADFYEALSAKDRPYKKPMPPEVILSILRRSAEAGEIDSDVLELMIRERVHERFEEEYEATRRRRDADPA